MIKITPEGEHGYSLGALEYVTARSFIGRLIMRATRYYRAKHASYYIQALERHLDIGCGDGYFLRRSPCIERYGLDKLLGDEISDYLDFPDQYFDYVTMLAVIEHLNSPELIIKEIWRVLKPSGSFILTTPKKSADWLIKFYAKDIDEEHESYFDYQGMQTLTADIFKITKYHTFILGMNQIFELKKLPIQPTSNPPV